MLTVISKQEYHTQYFPFCREMLESVFICQNLNTEMAIFVPFNEVAPFPRRNLYKASLALGMWVPSFHCLEIIPERRIPAAGGGKKFGRFAVLVHVELDPHYFDESCTTSAL